LFVCLLQDASGHSNVLKAGKAEELKNASSSSRFDPFPTLFIKRAETDFLDEQGEKQRANVSFHCKQIFSNFSYVIVYILRLGKRHKLRLYTIKPSNLFPKTTG